MSRWIAEDAKAPASTGASLCRLSESFLLSGRRAATIFNQYYYPFHQMIYERRPDIRAIVHAHTPALITFSIARKIPDTRIIPQAHHVCGDVGYAPYALPGSWQLGENIAHTFAQGYDAVLLENHGVVTAGPDLLTAFHRLETLDFCARTQIQASSLGRSIH